MAKPLVGVRNGLPGPNFEPRPKSKLHDLKCEPNRVPNPELSHGLSVWIWIFLKNHLAECPAPVREFSEDLIVALVKLFALCSLIST
jgi:hypothetical protein